ncbi:hypothetical protein R5H30_10720 [Sulfitobacter sp. D35]|uniref:hypothetical protein n=1 Tax=Sulfitobacter sp. D35 TaxID=3083252 RepID=UPI00296F7D61|nr:hypothetical protein [Sulfitobacter sp. D35]MDW4498455.1 hypothetical protein [Sulfitobacter sp. D35]
MRAFLAAALLAVAAPALADETSGTVHSFDAATNALTFTDRTVWLLPAGFEMPLNVTAGDKLRIVYVSNADNGWQKIVRIERTEARPGQTG